MDKVRDAASKVQNTLRPAPAAREHSVTSVRLAPRDHRGDIESGQGGHSNGGLFRRAIPTRINGPHVRFNNGGDGGNFFSNALANVRDFVQRDPRESSTPLTGETEPEALERRRLAKERAEYDQQVLDLLDVIGTRALRQAHGFY